MTRFVLRRVDLRPGEARALGLGFALFFVLLGSWYLLRAVREEMGILGGTDTLKWLFGATFGATLLVAPAFAWIASRLPRRRVVPMTHHATALVLCALWVGLSAAGSEGARTVAARVAFVALSVYALFVVSVFWSLMSDVFDEEQARRLFGAIAAGGTCGALAGPALAAFLALKIGTTPLFLVATGLVEVAALLAHLLARVARARTTDADVPLGGSLLEGFRRTLQQPFLRNIALQTLVITTLATFLYMAQARIVRAAIEDSGERTALFATMDLATNAMALGVQAFVTGPLLSRWGLFAGLAVVPALSLVGFVALAALPLLALPALSVLIAFQVARRALHHAIERPAREVMFTSVEPTDRYKSKSFVDTVVYRGGDAASAWAHDGMALVSPIAPALAAAAVACGGMFLASSLAARHRSHSTRAPGDQP